MSAPSVDLTTCDREPIHVPGAIQPFGALIVLDLEGRLVRLSRNAPELLGTLPAIGEPLDAGFLQAINTWFAPRAADGGGLDPIEREFAGRTFDIVGHRSGDWLILEFEPRSADAPLLTTFALKAQRALERIQRHTSLEGLLDVATEELWQLTGFDRVMTYRFRHDGSGHVVAERRTANLESFLGLRYPATDIPQQARRLFTLNQLRFIPDLAYQPVPIDPPCGDGAPEPLDLSHSMLRSVSPVHVEYLQNMDVTASMSISLVVGGQLWGLFACHHYSGARLVPQAVRISCSLISQVVSVLVERTEISERARALETARALREQLGARARAGDDIVASLAESPSFLELVAADGGTLLWEKRVLSLGRTPSAEVVALLVDWLRSRGENLVQTQALALEIPELAARLDGVAGLLAVCIQPEHDGWVVWFRLEETETVRWAGNPEKTYSEGPLGPRLNPRGSFREWRETVRGRAAPWRAYEIELAAAFRRDIQGVALTKLSEVERARDLMLAALGHDLRTPLSAITMAAALLSDASSPSIDLGKRIERSSGRMKRLIDQMLDLSRIQAGLGLGVDRTHGDLAAVVRAAVEEARTAYPGSELVVTIPDRVPASFDADRMAQVVSNLLSNARHHGQIGRPVRIELSIVNEGVVLSVINEGGPIAPATRSQLFQPFKLDSLKNRTNRGGLGLGLHIVHEIVKAHEGRIDVEDEGGTVVFRVVLFSAGTPA